MAEVAAAEEEVDGVVRERERRTRGDSSASTRRARRAVRARRWVGSGMVRVLGGLVLWGWSGGGGAAYREQGKAGSVGGEAGIGDGWVGEVSERLDECGGVKVLVWGSCGKLGGW